MFMGAPPRKIGVELDPIQIQPGGRIRCAHLPIARGRIRLAAMTAGRKPSGRTSGLPQIARVILVWLITAGALLLLGAILPGLHVEDTSVALIAAAVIGLINALLWPLLIRVALPFTVLTLGLGVLVLNGAVDPARRRDRARVQGRRPRGPGSSSRSASRSSTRSLTSLLAIDDDDFCVPQRRQTPGQAPRGPRATSPSRASSSSRSTGSPTMSLQRAIRDGNAPTIARWIHDGGAHAAALGDRLVLADRAPARPGCCTATTTTCRPSAGGRRTAASAIVTNHPKDAAEIERRHSDGQGLLHDDGASRANIVSGDAAALAADDEHRAGPRRPGRIGQDYFAYFANPYNVTRTIMLVIADIAVGALGARRSSAGATSARGSTATACTPLMRAWATVIQRDLQVDAVIGDLVAGPARRLLDLPRLRRGRAPLGRRARRHPGGAEATSTARSAASSPPRRTRRGPTDFVVLSDHGQSQGATFLQRYGEHARGARPEACSADAAQADAGDPSEAHGLPRGDR